MRTAIFFLVFLLALTPLAAQQGPAIITPSPLPNAVAAAPYSVTLRANFTGVQWLITGGALPPGLALDPNSGAISGTPQTAGSYNFTVQARSPDGAGPSKQFGLTVLPPLVISPGSPLPAGVVGQKYPQVLFMTTGGSPPYQYAAQPTDPFSSQALPPGMNLNPVGILGGTPGVPGMYTFALVVTDNNGYSATQVYSISILNALAFTTASPLPDGASGVFYSQTIAASGGQPPYVFSAQQLPPGLMLSKNGTLSGTPQAGAFTFSVTVMDAALPAISKSFQLTVAASAPLLQVSVASLSFAVSLGDSAPPQAFTIQSSGAAPVAFALLADAGQSNTAPPAWLSLSPASGMTPARVTVSVNAASLAAGTYTARIRVSAAGQAPIDIPVTLTVTAAPPRIAVAPAALNFTARDSAPGSFTQVLELSGSGTFTVAVDPAPWIAVSPAAGRAAPNQPAEVRVTVNTAGLAVGGYRTAIHITTSSGALPPVPVSLFVNGDGPVLSVSITGVRFQARQGNGVSNPQTVQVLNFGDPGTAVNWTAEIVQGGAWLSIDQANGSSSPANPAALTLRVNSAALDLAPRGYYALVRISDPRSLNSPQYVTVVLDVADAATPPRPDPVPQGLTAAYPAGVQPASQSIRVYTSSLAPVPFQASASTSDGAAWLSVSPSSGVASTNAPGQVTVAFNTANLKAGVYTGEVDFSVGGSVRATTVTLILSPSGSATAPKGRFAGGCAPSRLVLAQTALVNNFAVPAGWPTPLSVRLTDDCGTPVPNGSVAAAFSNGDPALSMRSDEHTGAYSATWQPGRVTPQTTVTVQASFSPLASASAQLIGAIMPNQAPVLNKGGTINNDAPLAALSPGAVAQVYGAGLATLSVSPPSVPLPVSFNGTTVLVGGLPAPLFFVSGNQVNVQIPSELVPGQQYPIIVSANGALTLPDTISVNAFGPGVAAFLDGHVIAQHSDATATLVDAGHPAKPGEALTIYLVGLGATTPAVKSGDPSPAAEPLARVNVIPAVSLDGMNATLLFAGLSPNFVGLYQINFLVPAAARSGDLDLVVTQNGVASNTTKLPTAR